MSQRQECHPTGPSSKAIRVWTLRILVGLISVAAIAYAARYAFAYGEYGCTYGCWVRSDWCDYDGSNTYRTTWDAPVARKGLDKDDLGNTLNVSPPYIDTYLHITVFAGEYVCDCQLKEYQTEGGGSEEEGWRISGVPITCVQPGS